MKKFFIKTLLMCVVVCALAFGASAQSKAPAKGDSSNGGTAILKGSGKVAVIIVGSAAKVAWAATKFVAKDMAKPLVVSLVKPAVTKVAPAIVKFALKNSFKYILPTVLRLSVL